MPVDYFTLYGIPRLVPFLSVPGTRSHHRKINSTCNFSQYLDTALFNQCFSQTMWNRFNDTDRVVIWYFQSIRGQLSNIFCYVSASEHVINQLYMPFTMDLPFTLMKMKWSNYQERKVKWIMDIRHSNVKCPVSNIQLSIESIVMDWLMCIATIFVLHLVHNTLICQIDILIYNV